MKKQADSCELKLGDEAPYFSLMGTDGRIHSLPDYVEAAALLVVFTCNHCPYARAYESRLAEIARNYRAQGLETIAICANDPENFPEDSFERMVEKSQALDFPFPYLHDPAQNVAKAYDAACTPEAYLFDRNRRLVYHGWVDDNYLNPEQASRHDLKDAVEAVLKNQTPVTQLTPVLGCSIKWK